MVLVSKMNLPVHNIALGQQDAPEISAAGGHDSTAAVPQLNVKETSEPASLLAASTLQPPPPPEQAPAAESTPRPSDSLVPARLIASVQPAYPLLAKQAHIEGNVVIEAQVDAAGYVTGTRVISGPQALRQAAMHAVAQWRYEPARLRDWPTSSTTTITLRFILH
jgi:protein TonB